MTSAVILERGHGKAHNPKVVQLSQPVPKTNEALVKIKAVALNHRDIWILDGDYPHITFDSVLGSDAVGTVSDLSKAAASSNHHLKVGDRVLIMPSTGWLSNPLGPEDMAHYALRGGSPIAGLFTQYASIDQADLFKAPEHLTDVEAAGLPLSGLTAYRAVFTKGRVAKGQNVLVTGIGGGVALFALQYAAAVGANVYVTSSDEAKIERAKQYGAKGGVNYRNAKWDEELLKLTGGHRFDVVIDSANGANAMAIIGNVLGIGGALVSFGQTAGPFQLEALYFVRQIEIRGTAMGSRAEFEQMLAFVTKHGIRPVVGDVFEGIDKIPDALQHLRDAKHFGKVVITL
ncbi:hypothetical protein DFQ27_008239 [Actinomortierella ambigua]|uniref:Enoyl reductase (ER) domain-containing protein n=1 Tax=Actinomortierella ambigua TaxID=1343610 RepID=A0A9P6TZ24_9FUNG|nr:hypothetical protein DFQ27_008239 [Actinomortierella ambigua]